MIEGFSTILLEHGRNGEQFRSRRDIATLMAGLTLLPSRPQNMEGLVPVGEWWPDGPTLIRPTPLDLRARQPHSSIRERVPAPRPISSSRRA